MKIYSYVVRFDSGFAPNPFGDYCSLATCKPRIRKSIHKDDWVVGTGSVENVGNNKMIYAMKVQEILTFTEYWIDQRFQYKKPIWNSDSPEDKLGDNIYYEKKIGKFHQIPSKHSNRDGTENKKLKAHDLHGKYVLISKDFYYFGKKAILIPKEHKAIIKKGPGCKCNFTENFVSEFIGWLTSLQQKKGYQGDPYSMKSDIIISHKCIKYDGTQEDDED